MRPLAFILCSMVKVMQSHRKHIVLGNKGKAKTREKKGQDKEERLRRKRRKKQCRQGKKVMNNNNKRKHKEGRVREGETTKEITGMSLTVSLYTGREDGRKGGQKEGS